MAEIDLIPQEYRTWLSQRAMMQRYGILFGACTLAVFVAGYFLSDATGRVRERVAALQSQNAITRQQQAELERLNAQQAEFEKQWSLLRSLRAGVAVEDIFQIIDRSLNGNELWFNDWTFRRAGVVVDGEQRGVETGYFIVVQADGEVDGDWQVETHMTISGQAEDHQALSTFVRALFEQKDVRDVNVHKTSMINYGVGRVVDFDMTVVLNSAMRGS